MKNLHNVEKSGFHRGQYVGYAHGPWRIVRYGRGWHASKGGASFARRTLEEISEYLEVLAEALKGQSAA